MDRRHFLSMLGLGAVGLTLPGVAQADILKQAAANPNIKPISGSWFEFQHPGGKEGVYWDKDLRQFTAAQWREKIREISETGMEYLVMMYNPQIEMFARFKMKSSFHKTKRII